VLAVFTQFLKAVRLRVEMRWTAAARGPVMCCAAGGECGGLSGSGAAGPGLKQSSSKSSQLAESEDAPSCCGGGSRMAVAPETSAPLPVSRRRPWWRHGQPTLLGVPLPTRAVAGRNFWRSVFTFVVMLLDYGENSEVLSSPLRCGLGWAAAPACPLGDAPRSLAGPPVVRSQPLCPGSLWQQGCHAASFLTLLLQPSPCLPTPFSHPPTPHPSQPSCWW
jgi:hypothetical protein